MDGSVPQPKVRALDAPAKALAAGAEAMLKNELERTRFDQIRILQELESRKHGGFYLHVDWDERRGTHTTQGEVVITPLYANQVLWQPGVRDWRTADWVIVCMEQTCDFVRNTFGVDVEGAESARSGEAGDVVTHYYCYERDGEGNVGIFSFVDDIVVQDNDDYRARRIQVCAACGRPRGEGKTCGCGGSKWESVKRDAEVTYEPIALPEGAVPAEIPPTAWRPGPWRFRNPAAVRPGSYRRGARYPTTSQNPSHRALCQHAPAGGDTGRSEIARVFDLLNDYSITLTRIKQKIVAGGSIIAKLDSISIDFDDVTGMAMINCASPQEVVSGINLYNTQGDISKDMAYAHYLYQCIQQALGVTQSYMGRRTPPPSRAAPGICRGPDRGAAGAQVGAGRERHGRFVQAVVRVPAVLCRRAPLHDVFRPRAGDVYGVFDRHSYLQMDAAGEWFYNDRFLFGIDAAGTLEGNREAMWRQGSGFYQMGAFGQPGSPDAQALYWQWLADNNFPQAEGMVQKLRRKQSRSRRRWRQASFCRRRGRAAQGEQAAQGSALPPELLLAAMQAGGVAPAGL